jgi:hypothetical protein
MTAPELPTSPVRRPWPLWIAFVAFAVTAVSVPMLPWLACIQRGLTLAELTDHVRQEHPELHLLPTNKSGDLKGGFYVSDRPVSWTYASSLYCDPGDRDHWQGIVLCRAWKRDHYGEAARWKDGGASLPGGILIVGDPKIVAKLRGG